MVGERIPEHKLIELLVRRVVLPAEGMDGHPPPHPSVLHHEVEEWGRAGHGRHPEDHAGKLDPVTVLHVAEEFCSDKRLKGRNTDV